MRRKDRHMARTIPLIRAGSILPFLDWLQQNGVAVEGLVEKSDLASFDLDNPDQPIPLLFLLHFASMASRIVGPDLPVRVVTGSSLAKLGTIGRIALSATTVRDALMSAMATVPYHVSYEMVSLQTTRHGIVLRESWGVRMDDESRHIAQQYAAAIIQSLCDPDGTGHPIFTRMAIVAHPVHGVTHLGPHFGDHVIAAHDKSLELHIPDHVLDHPLVPSRSGSGQDRSVNYTRLPIGVDGLIPSTRIVVDGLLAHGTPTMEKLAAAGGQSVRTFQRRLAEAGTSFSRVVDEVRRARAMAGLAATPASVAAIAEGLGYKRQSSLTRAVRRWSGATPRKIRSRAGGRNEETPDG
jgi:AraC-like DNA-binding protein